MSTSATERFLKPAEVWTTLRIDRATFYRLVASGELPAVRVGEQIRVSSDELHDWIYGYARP
jgi:excisionase family DNA binding protein